MTTRPIDGPPPSTASSGVDEIVGSPIGSVHHAGAPTLSDALDEYDAIEEYYDDHGDPFEIGGVDVGLVLASLSVGTVLALLVAGVLVLLFTML